jgi:hypothetical protein
MAHRHFSPVPPEGMGGGITPAPTPVARPTADGAPAEVVNRIKVIEQKAISGGGEKDWKRQPSCTGAGATKVKSFHCKLTGDCLEFMDRQINEWLDAHPNCEVKHVTATVGSWAGKQMTEPNLIVQMWL